VTVLSKFFYTEMHKSYCNDLPPLKKGAFNSLSVGVVLTRAALLPKNGFITLQAGLHGYRKDIWRVGSGKRI